MFPFQPLLPEVALPLSKTVAVNIENGKFVKPDSVTVSFSPQGQCLTFNIAKSFIRITGLIEGSLNVVRIYQNSNYMFLLKITKQNTENTWFNSQIFAEFV